MRLPILSGALRGTWYLPASGGKLLRVLAGTYEPEQTAAFQAWIKPGGVVLDVGAHVGYYTLLASSLAGPTGAVWSFEPHPANFAFLRRHVEINRLGNVQVEQLAVSERPGTLRFESGRGSGTGRLASEGALSVTVTALDAFCDARSIRPTAIKIDVEGAELEVLRGAGSILRQCAPVLFLSTHGAKVHAACIESLRALGYGVQPIDAATLEGASELLAVKEGGQGRG